MPETLAASRSRTQRQTFSALPNPSSASIMIGMSVFRVIRRTWSCTSGSVEMTRSGAARFDALPTDPDSTRSSYPTIWAMRADSGSKMFAARVGVCFRSNARNISFFLDMLWLPFRLGLLLVQERPHARGKRFGPLDLGMVPGVGDAFEARAGNELRVGLAIGGLDHVVGCAPQHQSACLDIGKPALQLRVVHVRVKAVAGQRLPVARAGDELVVLHVVVARSESPGIVPAFRDDILRMRVEHVEYVGCFTVAHLDAQRVDEDERVDAPSGLDRDLRGEPGAKRQAHQRQRPLRQGVQKTEIKVNEVVNRAEIRRPRRAAEAGV